MIVSAGDFLDSIRNRPVMGLELSGRCFDARPLQRKEKQASDARKDVSVGGTAGDSGKVFEEKGLEGAAPFLLNTLFSVSLDTLITEKAVFTSIRSEGRIDNGRVYIDPIDLQYAGGSGSGKADIDLREVPSEIGRASCRERV